MKMQKNYKLALFAAVISFGLYSCSLNEEQEVTVQEELKDPTIEQAFQKWDELDQEAGFTPNLRRGTNFNYFEFSNNLLWFVPGEGYDPGPGPVPAPAPGFYPGIGTGFATRMKTVSSFINQFATFENGALVTVGAPASMFFAQELAAIGITNLSDDVSSVSTDSRGNAIFYKNISNSVTPVNAELSTFLAEVEVIGGLGKFKNSVGAGVVRGNFNPNTGKGASVTLVSLKSNKK